MGAKGMAKKRKRDALTFSCGPGVVAVALPGPPVELRYGCWDHNGDCLLPWRLFPLPGLQEDDGLMAAGLVADHETGLVQPYVVLQRGLSVLVGVLDVEQEQCDVVAEISLHGCFPPNKKKFVASPEKIIEDCWIVDGPTVVAMCHGRILVASARSMEFGEAGHGGPAPSIHGVAGHVWKAQVLLPHGKDKIDLKLLFCGNLGRDVGTEALCILGPYGSGKGSRAAEHGYAEECSWFSLHLDCLGDSAMMASSCADPIILPGWRTAARDLVTGSCDALSPASLKPSSISCIVAVPSPVRYGCALGADCEVDVVLGTVDKTLIRYRNGKVLATVELEEVPFSVRFAVVGGGQGVLLVEFKDSASTVAAICAETLEKLQSWTSVSGVVLSDVRLLGHDQIILFPRSDYWNSASYVEEQNYIVVTDLIISVQLGSNVLLSQSETVVPQDMPTFVTDSILNSLNSRLEAGRLELSDAQQEMSRKTELLASSCRLIQSMQRMGTDLHHVDDGRDGVEADVKLVRATEIYQKVHGHTWFLIVVLESRLPKGRVLEDLSLIITSQHGATVGQSSVLGSLQPGDTGKLVAAAPLLGFAYLPSADVNVLLTATTSSKKQTSVKAGQGNLSNIFTQWLSRIKLVIYEFSDAYQAQRSIECEAEDQLVVSTTTEEQLSDLPSKVKLALGMEDRYDSEHLDNRVHKFLTPPGLPWAEIAVACFHTEAVLSLRAEDSRHLVLMERCLRMQLRPEFKFLPKHCSPNMSNQVLKFAAQFLQELKRMGTPESPSPYAPPGSKRKLESGTNEPRSPSLSTLQAGTDLLCAEFLRLMACEPDL